jgi:hypothetical protein
MRFSRRYRHIRIGSTVLVLAAAWTIIAGPNGPIAAASNRPTTRAPYAGAHGSGMAAPRVRCMARQHKDERLAIKMAHDIDARLRARSSTVGMEETDGRTEITCEYHATTHFIAASVIKVTILAALLRKLQEQHLQLSGAQRRLAWLMITQSSNSAATALWNEVGLAGMQHFLNLARMRQTMLSQAWGLTLLTAHDEIALLALLTGANKVLSKTSRIYARYLMARVIPAQRWGVPAGAPRTVRVHLKNGWLPVPPEGPWEINSVGAFTSPHRVYLMAFLTYHNPSMSYGIGTIEDAAQAINRDLNPGRHDVVPASRPFPSWGIPDDRLP